MTSFLKTSLKFLNSFGRYEDFLLLILTTFINYLDFLHFLVAKKKKKKRSKLLMSAYNIGHQHVFTFNLL